MTLFSFLNPIHGCKLRVCQALILPSYQGSGLGKELLLHVYRSNQQNREIAELTVEDPCPGFQALRDAVDLEWYMHIHSNMEKSNGDESEDQNKTRSADDLSKRLKITKAQATFVLEALEYIHVVNSVASKVAPSTLLEAAVVDPVPVDRDGDGDREAKRSRTAASVPWKQLEADRLYVDFRLRVKRRLLKGNPDLKTLPKPEMQSELAELFHEEQLRFQNIEKLACDKLHVLEARILR